MRIATFTVSLPFAIAAIGCSDVECSMSEIKLADQCYPLRQTDAGIAADGSTTENAPSTDASVAADASRAREGGEPGDLDDEPASSDGSLDTLRDAAIVDAVVGALPPKDASDAEAPRPDADGPTPVADGGTSCVRAPEVCDGIDNDCNGQIDDAVGAAWYRDCDGDGFAVNAVGKVDGCTKPAPVSGCSGWTQRDPADPAQQDCDDAAAQRFPGAGFGLATKTSGDLNCDGTVESLLTFLENAPGAAGGPGGDHEPGRALVLCETRHVCACYDTEAWVIGYRGFDERGIVIAESAAPWYTRFSDTPNPPPCAQAPDEVFFLSYVHPGPTRLECNQNYEAVVVVRHSCR